MIVLVSSLDTDQGSYANVCPRINKDLTVQRVIGSEHSVRYECDFTERAVKCEQQPDGEVLIMKVLPVRTSVMSE